MHITIIPKSWDEIPIEISTRLTTLSSDALALIIDEVVPARRELCPSEQIASNQQALCDAAQHGG